MKKLLLIFVLFSNHFFSQDLPTFKFSKDIEPVIVDLGQSYTKEIIFEKINKWIQYTYNSPNEVIKASVPNEMLRFDGFQKRGMRRHAIALIYDDIRYTFQIEVKDYKYKLTLISLEQYYDDGGYYWRNAYPKKFNECFDKKGNLRGACKWYPESFEKLIINTNQSIYNFITDKSTATKNDNW